MIFSSNSFVLQAFLISSGITLCIALQMALMGRMGYRSVVYRMFSILSFSVTGYLLSTAWLYIATDIDFAVLALKVQVGTLCVIAFLLLRFIEVYTGRTIGNLLTVLFVGILFVGFIGNLFSEFSLRFSSIQHIEDLTFSWGESLSQFSGDVNFLS